MEATEFDDFPFSDHRAGSRLAAVSDLRYEKLEGPTVKSDLKIRRTNRRLVEWYVVDLGNRWD